MVQKQSRLGTPHQDHQVSQVVVYPFGLDSETDPCCTSPTRHAATTPGMHVGKNRWHPAGRGVGGTCPRPFPDAAAALHPRQQPADGRKQHTPSSCVRVWRARSGQRSRKSCGKGFTAAEISTAPRIFVSGLPGPSRAPERRIRRARARRTKEGGWAEWENERKWCLNAVASGWRKLGNETARCVWMPSGDYGDRPPRRVAERICRNDGCIMDAAVADGVSLYASRRLGLPLRLCLCVRVDSERGGPCCGCIRDQNPRDGAPLKIIAGLAGVSQALLVVWCLVSVAGPAEGYEECRVG